eukprot:2613547-Rhodomonas_salina.2
MLNFIGAAAVPPITCVKTGSFTLPSTPPELPSIESTPSGLRADHTTLCQSSDRIHKMESTKIESTKIESTKIGVQMQNTPKLHARNGLETTIPGLVGRFLAARQKESRLKERRRAGWKEEETTLTTAVSCVFSAVS